MHVVMVVPGGVDRGGTERVIPALLDVIAGMAERHRVTVVALGQEPVASTYPLLGATVINVPPERHGPQFLSRQLYRAVRAGGSRGRPDVVHGWWASVSGLAATLLADRHRVPSIVHVAGGELTALVDIGYGGALGRGGRMIGSHTLRRATVTTAASEWLAEHVRARGRRVDQVIALGADTAAFQPAPEQVHEPRLIHVASINRVKDQATLLRALAEVRVHVPEVTLDQFGVDTLGGEVQHLAVDLGVGDVVRWHGFTRHAQLPDHLRRAAINVITSRHEAGPLAVVEAAACGVPTIGTKVGHIADLAAQEQPAAIAVDVGDHVALANEIVGLLRDANRRRAIGERARRWAADNDARATVERFDALYHQVVARR